MISVNIVDCPSGVSESQKFAAADEVLKYLEDFNIDLLWSAFKDFEKLLEYDDSKAVTGNCAWNVIQDECNRIVYEQLGCKDWHAAKTSYNGVFPSAQIYIYGNCC